MSTMTPFATHRNVSKVETAPPPPPPATLHWPRIGHPDAEQARFLLPFWRHLESVWTYAATCAVVVLAGLLERWLSHRLLRPGSIAADPPVGAWRASQDSSAASIFDAEQSQRGYTRFVKSSTAASSLCIRRLAVKCGRLLLQLLVNALRFLLMIVGMKMDLVLLGSVIVSLALGEVIFEKTVPVIQRRGSLVGGSSERCERDAEDAEADVDDDSADGGCEDDISDEEMRAAGGGERVRLKEVGRA